MPEIAASACRARSGATQHRLAAGERLGPEPPVDKIPLAAAEQARVGRELSGDRARLALRGGGPLVVQRPDVRAVVALADHAAERHARPGPRVGDRGLVRDRGGERADLVDRAAGDGDPQDLRDRAVRGQPAGHDHRAALRAPVPRVELHLFLTACRDFLTACSPPAALIGTGTSVAVSKDRALRCPPP